MDVHPPRAPEDSNTDSLATLLGVMLLLDLFHGPSAGSILVDAV